jgi:NAD(P)H-hydrate epimerase
MGTFGGLLIVAGSRNYVGAAALAAEAAYRVGTGLVTIAAPESIHPILAASLKEATHLPLPEAEAGHIGVEAVPVVREALTRYDALVVGCGIAQHLGTRAFLERLLLDSPENTTPLLVDADGLTHLAHTPGWPERLAWPAVLTPHVGEMARLTGASTQDVQADRLAVARSWASRWGKVVVLKGAYSIIASPDGRTMVSPFANPALASAGTGDVLAGAIGGLLAQGMTPFEAAGCGAYLHAAAGEMVREEIGDAGLLAGDLLPRLPKAIRNLRA